jgi:hypothetical protein
MPKTIISKRKVLVSIDIEIAKLLKKSNLKTSRLVNELLWKHFSHISNRYSLNSDNRMVPSSNLGQVIFEETGDLRLDSREMPYLANSSENLNIEKINIDF